MHVFILLFQTPKIIKERVDFTLNHYKAFLAGKGNNNSIGVRVEMWMDSIKMFKVSPIIGIGISDFKNRNKELVSQGVLKPRREFGHAHSIYFNILATTGLLGFIGLLFFVFWLPLKFFLKIWRNTESTVLKFYSLSGIILISSFMVFGLTESWLSRNPFVRTYLILMVLFMSSIMYELKKAEAEKSS